MSVLYLGAVTLNVFLVVVHGKTNTRRLVKYYYIVPFAFAAVVSHLPFAEGVYGLRVPEMFCWYVRSDIYSVHAWEWGLVPSKWRHLHPLYSLTETLFFRTLYGWLSAAIVFSVFVLSTVIIKLLNDYHYERGHAAAEGGIIHTLNLGKTEGLVSEYATKTRIRVPEVAIDMPSGSEDRPCKSSASAYSSRKNSLQGSGQPSDHSSTLANEPSTANNVSIRQPLIAGDRSSVALSMMRSRALRAIILRVLAYPGKCFEYKRAKQPI